jgi:hypothetical protein
MDDTAVSLSRRERECITEHGRDIGKSLHATITLIRDFIDFLSKQPIRYSMFDPKSTIEDFIQSFAEALSAERLTSLLLSAKSYGLARTRDYFTTLADACLSPI